MRAWSRAALVLAAVAAASGCASPKKASVARPTRLSTNGVTDLVIITTTDFHASLTQAEGLAKVVRELRARYGDQLIHLDGGDLFQGQLEGNLSKGKSIIELYNLLGVDAAAIGNHDFDYGPDAPVRVTVNAGEDGMGTLKLRAREAKFKWLSANIVVGGKRSTCRPRAGDTVSHCNALGQRTVFPPRAIFQRADQKVCVIGATTPTTPAITRSAFIKGTRFEELKPVVVAEAKFLRDEEKCDTVILMSHAGLLCAPGEGCHASGDRAEILRLLHTLKPGTLDAVVAGHNHMLAAETINATPVIQAGIGGKHVGVLRLSGRAGTRTFHYEEFIPVPETASEPDVTAALKPYRDAAAVLRSRPVALLKNAFVRDYHHENPLGNLVADSLLAAGREVEQADFAITNAGGIRADLPAGPLNYGQVFAALPFENALSIVTLRGSELRRVIEIAMSGGHGVSPIAGLRVKRLDIPPGVRGNFDRDLDHDGKKEDWERNVVVEISDDKGRLIDDNKMYKVATIDFLVDGGDHQQWGYVAIPKHRRRDFPDVWARDVLADYLRKRGTVDPLSYFDPNGRRRLVLIAPSH